MESKTAALIERSAPRTLALLGLGPIHTAQMLVTAGQNIDRLRGETAFAHLCAADPIPASSGKTTRHRLNPNGDRHANRTLHMITVVRLRYCQRTRAYVARRTVEGLSKKDTVTLPQGARLGSVTVPNGHRLLRFSGEISPDFRWTDPDRTDDPAAVLQAEGVRFDPKGRASAGQRLTAVELAAFADFDVDIPEAQPDSGA